MTADEHYRRAETLLANVWDRSASGSGNLIRTPEQRAEMLAAANTHALLALFSALQLTPEEETL